MINKTDLAPAVGADLAVMERDALRMRDGGPLVFAQVYFLIRLFNPCCFNKLILRIYIDSL